MMITDAAGSIGQALTLALRDEYQVIGLDRETVQGTAASYTFVLDWAPRHAIASTLAAQIGLLKNDAANWYASNGITPPDWVEVRQ